MTTTEKTCKCCGEEYGPASTVPASDRPGYCASCAEALNGGNEAPQQSHDEYIAELRAMVSGR